MDPSEHEGYLKEALALEAILKESFLDQEAAEMVALWTKGCPPIASKISPSLSKAMDIMKSFTAEDMVDKTRKHNPKNFQSEIKIQKLPTEIITQIFKILLKDFQEMFSLIVHPWTRDKHSGTHAYYRAICLGLTCRHYWDVFSKIWCHAGTNTIIYRPPQNKKIVLALHLKNWAGPKYRIGNRSSWSCARVPMFLSREVYGSIGSLAEILLEGRYRDYMQLSTCKSSPSTGGLPSNIIYPSRKGVLSPFGMGESWYTEAARQFCAGLDCCLVAPALSLDNTNAARRIFWQSHLFEWAHYQDLLSTSKFQEEIRRWLRSYAKRHEEHQNISGFWAPDRSWFSTEWYLSEKKNPDEKGLTALEDDASQ